MPREANIMQQAVEIFALIHLMILGLSHIVQRDVWAEMFVLLAKCGRSGVFFHGFLSLWFGSIVIAFYGIYRGPGLVLTAFGWLVTFKALHCFCFPGPALRSLQRVSVESSWKFVPVGAVYLLLACIVAYRLVAGV